MRIMIDDLLKPTIERIKEAICAWKLTGIFKCCCGFEHETRHWAKCSRKWIHECTIEKLDPWTWCVYEPVRDILLLMFRQNSYDDEKVVGRIIEYELLHANKNVSVRTAFIDVVNKIESYQVQLRSKENAIWLLNHFYDNKILPSLVKYLVLGRNKQESDELWSGLDFAMYKHFRYSYPYNIPQVLLARFDEYDNVVVWLKAVALEPDLFNPFPFHKNFQRANVIIKTLQITPTGSLYEYEGVYMTPQKVYERLINEKKDNDYWVVKPYMDRTVYLTAYRRRLVKFVIKGKPVS
jgi:hypothetical protein